MILSINTGSSSIKAKLFEVHKGRILELQNFFASNISQKKISNFSKAFEKLIVSNQLHKKDIKKIIYRVVHGGDEGKNCSKIDAGVKNIIQRYNHLSPNHNPYILSVINRSKKIFKKSTHYAFFDTAYFNDMPNINKIFPLPEMKINNILIKKYGFHGLSHQYMYEKVAKGKKAITVHLGAGCSVAAIDKDGPVDTSMGLTPLGGLPMLTRTGDLDPGVILEIVGKYGLKKAYNILSKESGLISITSNTKNMLDILYQAYGYVEGDERDLSKNLPTDKKSSKLAEDAIKTFVTSIQKYICEYYIKLNGCSYIIFSGRIGHGSKKIRSLIIKDIRFLNIEKIETVETDEEKMMVSLLIRQ